jgi:hypothetical protein
MTKPMSELPIAPHQFRLVGILLLVLGSILLIIGLVFAFGAAAHQSDNNNQVKNSAAECIDHISALGLKANADGAQIHIGEGNMKQAVELLAKSSQAISLCPEWALSQYCLGLGCKPPGLTMVLQYHEHKN